MKRNQDLLSLNPPAKWRHQQTFHHQLALRIQCRASVNIWYPPTQIPGSTHHHGSSNNTTHCTKPIRGYLVLPASALGLTRAIGTVGCWENPQRFHTAFSLLRATGMRAISCVFTWFQRTTWLIPGQLLVSTMAESDNGAGDRLLSHWFFSSSAQTGS